MANDGGIRVMEDDVMVEILLLLPAKSLARFKSVCKTWYNFIKNPNFIADYTNRNHNHNRLLAIHPQLYFFQNLNLYPEKLSLSCNIEIPFTFTLFMDESLSVRQNIIDNPVIINGCPFTHIEEILGPVNGLYCIRWCHYTNDYEESIAFWNPCTTEFRKLNYPSFPGMISPCRFGVIGFGSTDDDIKLVCVTNNEFDMYTIVLYSLAHDSWRQIKSDTYLGSFMFGQLCGSVNLNGSYYWLIYDSCSEIFVFDMRTEVFRDVSIPDEYRDAFSGMLVRNNSIVFCVTQLPSEYNDFDCISDVFEVKEEGCWNKIFSYVPPFASAKPLLFWKDDEIIFQSCDENNILLLYNISSNQTRNLGIDVNSRILNYKESLTSVKGGIGLIQVL